MAKRTTNYDLGGQAVEILKAEEAQGAILRALSHRPINCEFVDAFRACCHLVDSQDEELAAFAVSAINGNKDGVEAAMLSRFMPHGSSWTDTNFSGIVEALLILSKSQDEELAAYAEEKLNGNVTAAPEPSAYATFKCYAGLAFLTRGTETQEAPAPQEPEAEEEPALNPSEELAEPLQ